MNEVPGGVPNLGASRVQHKKVQIIVLAVCAAAALEIFKLPFVEKNPAPRPMLVRIDSCARPHPPEVHFMDCSDSDISPKELQQKADAGDAWALLLMGDQYYSGELKKKDFAEALRWYRRAADLGGSKQADAAIYIARLYKEGGHGINQDYKEAEKWYRTAADWGDSDAYLLLAHLYEKGGPGLQQNWEETYFWYDVYKRTGSGSAVSKQFSKEREDAGKHLSPAERGAVDKRAGEWVPPLAPVPQRPETWQAPAGRHPY